MSLITRYILRQLVAATVFVALALTVVVWLAQSLKLLELIAASDAPVGLFLKLVLLTVPRFLEIIIPVSLAIAVVFVYHKLIMDNELIVMRACGFDHLALARPLLMLACVLTIVGLALTTYLSPRSYAEMQVMRQHLKSEYTAFLLRDGVFNTFGRDLTVYVSERTAEGELRGLMIHDTRDREKPPVTITAARGLLLTEGDAPQIVVYDGMRQQIDPRAGILTKLFFSRYTIEIKGFADNGSTRWRAATERTLPELLSPDMNNRADRLAADEFLVVAHHRITGPFNTMGFSIVALAILMLGGFNRRGQTRKLVAAFSCIVALQTLDLAAFNAAKDHLALIPLLYIVSLGPVACGLFVMTERGESVLVSLRRRWQSRTASMHGAEGAA